MVIKDLNLKQKIEAGEKSVIKILEEASSEEIQEFISDCYSWADVFRKLGFNFKRRDVRNILNSKNLDISHFKYKSQIKKPLKNYTKEELQNIANKSTSWKSFCINLGYYGYKPDVKKYIASLGVVVDHFKYKPYNIVERVKTFRDFSKEELEEIVSKSKNWDDVSSFLGYSYSTKNLKAYIKELGIDISHFNSEIKKAKSLKNYTKEELQEIVNSVDNFKSLCEKLNNKACNSVKRTLKRLGVDYSHFIWQEVFDDQELKNSLYEMYGDSIFFIGPFRGWWTETTFYCKKHGYFSRKIYEVLRGKACPVCRYSKGELTIAKFLRKNTIDYDYQKTFDDCRYINPLPFDFGILFHNQQYVIEFQGEHHLKPVQYNGCSLEEAIKNHEMTVLRDKIKKEYCIKNNIRLIEIFSIKEIPEKLSFLVENKNVKNQPQEDFSTKLNEVNSQ